MFDANCAKSLHYAAVIENFNGFPTTMIIGETNAGKSFAVKCGAPVVSKQKREGVMLSINTKYGQNVAESHLFHN